MRHLITIALLWIFTATALAKNEITIGVLAHRGSDTTLTRWQHTAEYLSENIANYRFVIMPVTNDSIVSLTERAQVDFILTNPASYAFLEARFGITRILTLVNQTPYGGFTQYGSVVFTLKEKQIETIADLRGKSIMAVHPEAFGGWWMALREIKNAGINPYTDMSNVVFAGFPQDKIVHSVVNKEVDSGVVRTNILERMSDEGLIDLSQIHVLNAKSTFGFPYRTSTRLYPEWPLAMLKHVPEELAEKVVLTLLKMKRDHPAAQLAKIQGWTVPMDYQPIHELMKDLQVGHYKSYGGFTIYEVVAKYWLYFFIGLVFILLLLATIIYVLALYRRLNQSKEQLNSEIAEKLKAQHESAKFGRILEEGPAEIFVFDTETEKLRHSNLSAKLNIGLDGEIIKELYLYDLLPELPDIVKTKLRTAISSNESKKILHCECQVQRLNKSLYTAAVQVQLSFDGDRSNIIVIAQDISEFRKTETDLSQERERNELALQSIREAVITTDGAGMVEYLNPMAESLCGLNADKALGMHINEVVRLVDAESGRDVRNGICVGIEDRRFNTDESTKFLMSPQGDKMAVQETTIPRYNDLGELTGMVLILRDQSEMQPLNERMMFFITHDDLTGLINKRAFENEIKEAARNANLNRSEHALLYLELENFEKLHEYCGMSGCDEFLKQITNQLKSMVRGCDTLAKIETNRFGILLRGCTISDAQVAATRMQEAVNIYPFAWSGSIHHVGMSIGIVSIIPGIGKLRDILNYADAACFVARELGSNRIFIYDHDDDLVKRYYRGTAGTHEIINAIEKDRIKLFYQPIVPLTSDNKDIRIEVLTCLLNEKDHLLKGHEFVHIAERLQQLPKLDKLVIEHLFTFIENNDLRHHHFNLNISQQSVNHDGFIHFVTEALERHNINPENICFEFGESDAITNYREVSRFIRVIKDKGCRFALDDFGRGLSSFHYLKRLSVNYLKIDASFIRHIVRNPIDYAMVESFNHLAHSLNIRTIAEYVDNHGIYKEAARIGIDFAQGFEIGKPKPLETLKEWIQTNTQ